MNWPLAAARRRPGPALRMGAASVLMVALVAVEPVHAQSVPLPEATATQQPGLFKDLGRDVKGLASKTSLTWLGAGLAAAFGALTVDDYVAEHFSDAHGTEEAFEPGEILGGVVVQSGSAIAVYVLGKSLDNSPLAAVGADLVRAQIVTQAITQGVKYGVQRTRPDGTARSFPSGHSSTMFATVAVLHRYFGWKVGGPGYGLAVYVAASRLQSRKHYLSDVVFGATIGVVVGRAVTVGHGWATFAPVPSVTRGSVGLNFVRIHRGS